MKRIKYWLKISLQTDGCAEDAVWYVSIIGTALARRGVMKYDLIIDFEMCNVVGKIRKKAGGMRNEIIQIGAVMQSSS